MGYKIHFCDDFSSADFYLIPFFSRIVWINKLHDLMKGFFLRKVAMEIGKIHFSVIIVTIAKTKNASSKA